MLVRHSIVNRPSHKCQSASFDFLLTTAVVLQRLHVFLERESLVTPAMFSDFLSLFNTCNAKYTQKAAREQMDPCQEKTGGMHLILQPMDLLAHPGPTVDETVIQLRMVM